ncbi:HNH endonuclease (plasmid) [Cupriavidus sp. KK10]|jgi:5-methylcytosine-specific restriction endonuclease McrA|uniref:RNA-guided endonuclease IscB n=1 Tax=Cupriavidus sp. KK10 TaxID=1478019 RepID=UPI001BAC50FE|nr:RNA-guided endonuclease IscB [Cupriavidus sp. KK10]QUN31821.1 HNH endonuclease [Cupriavidus sp. KK10]
MAVFVLDKHSKALMPCSEKRARLLLERGRARVHRLMPFTIRLTDRCLDDSELQPLRLKLDPGSKETGVAIVRETTFGADGARGAYVLSLAEIIHRGRQISEALTARRSMRRARRGRKTRYRAARFDNRRKPKGWLAPSLLHRVVTTEAWVRRFSKVAPLQAIGVELVRFDTQAMENPEISGVEYQQGTLLGYELKEYLLAKFGRTCSYCDAADRPLETEHIVAKANGGSNRVSNLTLACRPCNEKKGKLPLEVFLRKDPARAKRILARAKAPLGDAAAVNTTRLALLDALKAFGLPVETGSGGQTKYNRRRLEIPKSHALDAACVGQVHAVLDWQRPALRIKCTGRGSYQRTRLSAHGFPRGYLMRSKRVFGFQTGDMVKAIVPTGKKAGTYVGRVAIRVTGFFNIQTAAGAVQGISHKHCKLIQRGDGYGYQLVAQTAKESENRGDASRRALSLPGLKAEVSRAN